MAVVASEKCRRNRLFVAYCFCATQTYHIFQSLSIVILKNDKWYLTFVDFYSEKHSCFVNVRAIVDNVRMWWYTKHARGAEARSRRLRESLWTCQVSTCVRNAYFTVAIVLPMFSHGTNHDCYKPCRQGKGFSYVVALRQKPLNVTVNAVQRRFSVHM